MLPAGIDVGAGTPDDVKEGLMSLLDRILGRGKKAAGEIADDPSLRREGMHQEHEARAEERAARHEELAQEERERAAEHHVQRDN
jgi:uncharacterized protein YjbJ (UPF0337 family)